MPHEDDGADLPEAGTAAQTHPANGRHAAPPSVEDPLTELAARLGALESAVGALTTRLGSEAERAAARERVIERQREEIERLRGIERVGMLRPVVTDLCRLRNDLLRQAASVATTVTADGAAKLLRSFADGAEEALERCGITVLPHEVGAPFEAGRHQAAGVVKVAEPERDGTIAAVVQDGYAEIDGGKVVAPARVTLHRSAARPEAAARPDVTARLEPATGPDVPPPSATTEILTKEQRS